MADCILASDGLPARPSGSWIKRKHHYLQRYCRMFATGMKNKWPDRTFVDFMAGPGLCKIRDTGEEVSGSPLIALEEEFTAYHFFEQDPESCRALDARTVSHPRHAAVTVHPQNWIEAVVSGEFELPSGLVLVFLDPTGISQVPWRAVEKLTSSSPSLDVLMTIQHAMGIKLNEKQYLERDSATALDAFLGDNAWREDFSAGQDLWTFVWPRYRDRWAGQGFRTTAWRLVRTDSGLPLYYVALFARHDRALDFWKKAGLVDESGQRQLPGLGGT